MLETTMMFKLTQHNWHWFSHVYTLCFSRGVIHPLRETDNFIKVYVCQYLFKYKKGLMKLLQKQHGAAFFASQCNLAVLMHLTI